MESSSPPPMPEDVDAAVAEFENDAVVVADAGEPPVTNGDAPAVEVNGDADEEEEPVTVSAGEDVTAAILGGPARSGTYDNLRSGMSGSTSPVPVRVEPETLRKWREEHTEMLREKDKKEEEQMAELREQAKKELQDWYKKYEEQLEKTKGDNRASEKTFVAEINEIEPGTEWERVAKLCEFSVKSNAAKAGAAANASAGSAPPKPAKDLSRMRSILLQLKQNPKLLEVNK